MADVLTCLICLDPAKRKIPLYLLDCGCKISYFHLPCEREWINHQEYPYNCPACRRLVPMKTNYSFSIYAGADQLYLWHTIGLLVLEGLISCILEFYIMPLISLSILTIPFIVRSRHNLNFFIWHLRSQLYYTAFFLCLISLQRKIDRDFYYGNLYILGYSHLFTIYLVHFIVRPEYGVDTFEPYAISREIYHISITESAPKPAKRDNIPRRRGKRRKH